MSTNRTPEEIDAVMGNMDEYEISRWTALLHGIEKIVSMADAKKVCFDSVHIDQPALNKYVDEVSDDVLFAMKSQDILQDIHEGNTSVLTF